MNNKIGCRIETEIIFRGWRMVVLENKNLRVSILPEKGSDIIEFRYKPLDLDIMWESPLGLRSKEWFLATNGGGTTRLLAHHSFPIPAGWKFPGTRKWKHWPVTAFPVPLVGQNLQYRFGTVLRPAHHCPGG